MSGDAGPDRGRDTATVGVDSAAAEAERLSAQRDTAAAGRNRRERRARHRGTARRVAVGFLVVLFVILLPITVTVAWAHRTILNTDAYMKTVTPIAADPAVTAAVSRQVTDQLYASLDPQAVIADALPPKAAFLAGPIATGAKGLVQQAVNKVLDSDQFQQLWVNANRFAHTQLVTVLRGDSKVLQTTNGQVVLNLVPLLNEALKNAQDFVSGVVGKPVTLPTIKGDELPSAACEKIATALDRPVPTTCGQIALFPADQLQNAQRAVRAFDRGTVALLVITPLIALGALVVSRRRRRTLLQLTIGGMLALVVVRRALIWLQNDLIDAAKPQNKQASSAIVHSLLNGFFALTLWMLVAGLVVIAVALLTGPYRWAVATRNGVVTAGKKTGQLVSAGVTGTVAHGKDQSTLAWVRGHFDLLRIAGVVVAILLLLIFSVNIWGFLVIVALLALYEVWLHRLRPPAKVTLPPGDQPKKPMSQTAEATVPKQPPGPDT